MPMELSDASLDLQHHGKQHRINKHKTNAYATWSRPLYSYTDITERLLRLTLGVRIKQFDANILFLNLTGMLVKLILL
jgi:hypothetical protein